MYQSAEPPLCKTHLYRIETEIVGIQYYDGRFILPGPLEFVRNPWNADDHNAIQVKSSGMMCGHLRKELAAALAKFLDKKVIELQGTIFVTGIEQFIYKIPIYVDIWTLNRQLNVSILKDLKERQHYSLECSPTVPMPKVSIFGTKKYEAFKIWDAQMNEIKKETFVSEKELTAISRHIGQNYRILGINLGLKDKEISHVVMDYNLYGIETVIFEMLLKWKVKYPHKATRREIIRACKKTGDIEIKDVQKCFRRGKP